MSPLPGLRWGCQFGVPHGAWTFVGKVQAFSIVGGQKSGGRSQRSKVRVQKSEARSQRSEVWALIPEFLASSAFVIHICQKGRKGLRFQNYTKRHCNPPL